MCVGERNQQSKTTLPLVAAQFGVQCSSVLSVFSSGTGDSSGRARKKKCAKREVLFLYTNKSGLSGKEETLVTRCYAGSRIKRARIVKNRAEEAKSARKE